MNKNREVIIDHHTQRKLEGTDFTAIRRELASKGYDAETISEFVQAIDKRVLDHELNKSGTARINELKLIGWFLIIAGLMVTGITYFGILDLNGNYILAYGPVLAGIILIFTSRGQGRRRNFPGKKRFHR